jgi:hypothetical protein
MLLLRLPGKRLPATLHVLRQFANGVVLPERIQKLIVRREKRVVDESGAT